MSKARFFSLMTTIALLLNEKLTFGAQNADFYDEDALQLSEYDRIDPIDNPKFVMEKIYVEKDRGTWRTLLEIES